MMEISPDMPLPKGRFWKGKTWGEVIGYYAEYSAKWPFCDGHAKLEGGRLYLIHFGGRSEPTMRQLVPKSLERFMIDTFREKGGQIEIGPRYGGILPGQQRPQIMDLEGVTL